MNTKLVKVVTVSGIGLSVTGIGLLLSSKSNKKKVRLQASQSKTGGKNFLNRTNRQKPNIEEIAITNPYYLEDNQMVNEGAGYSINYYNQLEQ